MGQKIKMEEEVEQEFRDLIDNISDEDYNKWVMGWIDHEFIEDIYKNWDIETKKEEIRVLKDIINGDVEIINF